MRFKEKFRIGGRELVSFGMEMVMEVVGVDEFIRERE